MEELRIELSDNQIDYAPGDHITGKVSWNLDKPPDEVELWLFWYAESEAEYDVEMVHSQPFDTPGQRDQRPFDFTLPAGPQSFIGQLITLNWGLELSIEPGERTQRVEIVVAPDKQPIKLPAVK